MKKTRVLIVVAGFGYGGIRAFVMNYLNKLDLNKFSVDIYVLNRSDSPFQKDVEEIGCRIYFDKETFSSKRIPYFVGKWKKFFRRQDYDVVHANCNLTSVWILLAAKMAGVKNLIPHTHTSEYSLAGPLMWHFFVSFRRMLINKISTYKLACGEKAGTSTYGKDSKYYIINNCIDYKLFKAPTIDEKLLLREKLLGSGMKNIPIYCNISLFCENKNQTFVLDIFREIKKIQPNAFLLLGGPAPDEESNNVLAVLRQNILKYQLQDSVKIIGTVSNMRDYYSIIDCWLFPSLHEGLPITLLELQAASVPIISSDAITKDSDLGLSLIHFLSVSDSPSKWAKMATSQTKNNLDDKLIEKAFIESGFDFSTNLRILEDCYLGLL